MATEYNYKVNKTPITNQMSTIETFFDITFIENHPSAIDNFFINTDDLNLLIASITIADELKKKNSNLILLGQISAVESYLREVIRKIILNDEESKKTSSIQQLSYGAALNHTLDILPESLLESYSFASKKNILDAFNNFLNIKGQPPEDVSNALMEFERICQLRHCVIHRFGKLGSANALKLGMENLAQCLEKPLALEDQHLYDTYIVCQNLVLVLNNFLFKTILQRTVNQDDFWHWDLRRDKNKFQKYYNIFKSVKESEVPEGTMQSAYYKLKEYKNELLAAQRRRGRRNNR